MVNVSSFDQADFSNPLDLTVGEIAYKRLGLWPCVALESDAHIHTVASMLVYHLESYCDGIAIVDEEWYPPIGSVGGKEVLECLRKNISDSFFHIPVEKITNRNLVFVNKDTTVREILSQWRNTKRAYALYPKMSGFSCITARSFLDLVAGMNTEKKVSELKKRDIVTFSKKDTLSVVLDRMFANSTRKLLLDDTNNYISDRLIIQKLVRDFDKSRIENLLETKMEEFPMGEAKMLYNDVTIQEVSEIMSREEHPFVLFDNKTVTPWDICMHLSSIH